MDPMRNKNIFTAFGLAGFVAIVYYYSISAVEDANDTFSKAEMDEIQMEIDQELAEQKAIEAKLGLKKK